MRQIGTRVEQVIVERASGSLLAQGALFIEAMSKFSPVTFSVNAKGVYRYKSHDEAAQHELDCLVEGMGQLAAKRAK
jgi:hypothetical protein